MEKDRNSDDINNSLDSQPTAVLPKKSDGIVSVYEWTHSIVFAIAIVVLILTFCFRIVNVDGPSMLNTLHNNDKLLVSDLGFSPSTGDVVIISHGQQYADPLVKRVIATAGQTLDINFDTGEVRVDGVLLDEPYISSFTVSGDNDIPSVIPEGKVFVMGDNRSVSLDSRSKKVGLINESDIIGKAYFILFPFNRFSNIY